MRRHGHTVTVVAPSSRAADLLEGRRALQRGVVGDVVAIGAAVPTSLSERVALPMGVRANLAATLALGAFDVVHGFEPGLPSLSSTALLEAETTTAATFFSTERIAIAPRKNQRAKFLARVDALLGTSEAAVERASERYPGDYQTIPLGIDTEVFAPARKRKLIVVELAPGQSAVARAVLRLLPTVPGWEVVLARTAPLTRRPTIPAAVRDRARTRSLVKPEARRSTLAEAAIFVPAPGRQRPAAARGRLERLCDRRSCRPRRAAGARGRGRSRGSSRTRRSARARARRPVRARCRATSQSSRSGSRTCTRTPRAGGGRWRTRRTPTAIPSATATGSSSTSTCTPIAPTTARSSRRRWSKHAEAEGLGAIAVTDHNVFAGALETVEIARHRKLIVIPGEEVKTDNQGEIIGLFLREEIPRGMTFTETIEAIRAQDGIVYVPHPFDRMHAIPSPATLLRHLPEIDVLEVYNARLMFDAYNAEALRFQRKYGLLAGAGSDAHVLQGVGTGALRMRRFDGPEEFLLSLRSAEVLRRPKSLAYLQSLKWAAQVKEKVL